MSVRMRHTKAHTGHRRSHHRLIAPRLSKCAKCGQAHIRHRVCLNCGSYRSREIIDVMAQLSKKEKKRKTKTPAVAETNA